MLAAATPASAHGYIVRSIPDNRAVLERAPTRVQYWFSEDLEPEFSGLTVRDQTGQIIVTGGVAEEDHSLLTARLPANLPDGAYVAELRIAFASDGHVTVENRAFFVGQAVGNVTDMAARGQADTFEVVWRTLALTSTLVLFGTFTLYSGVLIPAWGSLTHRAGMLPARVMKRLNGIVIAALPVALVSTLMALLQQAMVFFNADAGQVISQGLWNVVRVGTRFGDVWNVRVLLLVLVALLHGLSIYYRDVYPEAVRPFWTANAWGMALVLGTWSIASHAAGSLVWPWVAMLSDWLHLLAVGFWTGGLAALVLTLPAALRPYHDEERRLALLAGLSRFSRVAVVSVAVVIATGIYSAFNWLHMPSDVTQTSYGGALVAKLLLAAALLLAGLTHHMALRPERFRRWSRLIARAQQFTYTLRLEAVMALPVLAAAALLSATPVPVPQFAQQSFEPPTATQTAGGWMVTATISPGGPGVNTYDIVVNGAGAVREPPDEVQFQMVHPVQDRRSRWQEAEAVEGGLYTSAGDEIDRAGEWWMLVDVTDSRGAVARAAFDWNIEEEAAVIESRNPGVLNLLALGGVIAALGAVVYPSARRFYYRLDLSPASVTVAVGATAVTVLFVVAGVVVIQNTQAQYEASLNPVPRVVNSVLPDAESLARGQVLYDSHCADWQVFPDDLGALIDRLPRSRDEELFAANRNGWQSLPPCGVTLSDDERWDVVNFFRTFERRSDEG
jgi:copper transport protein